MQLEHYWYVLFCAWESAFFENERQAYSLALDEVKAVQKEFVRNRSISVISSFVEDQIRALGWAEESSKPGRSVARQLDRLKESVERWPVE